MKKIVAIGGGTGLSVLLRGMKKYEYDLTAIVSVADDGGNSGMLRSDLDILPPGDARSCILALASEESEMQELLNYRFSIGTLVGQNVGNLLIAAGTDIYGSFEEAIVRLSKILKIQGRVLPVTASNVSLAAELENGNYVIGESQIPRVSLNEKSQIARVFLEPKEAIATEKVLGAIEQADLIFLGPGSLFTSIIPNLLVKGIREALEASDAKKVYICNLMTQPGETSDYSLEDHIRVLSQYLSLDCALINKTRLMDEALEKYKKDGSVQVLPIENKLKDIEKKYDIILLEESLIEINNSLVRHNADMIAKMTEELL